MPSIPAGYQSILGPHVDRVWYPTYGMRKTSVYLTDDEAEGLRPSRTFRSLAAGRGGGKKAARWTSDELHRTAMGKT